MRVAGSHPVGRVRVQGTSRGPLDRPPDRPTGGTAKRRASAFARRDADRRVESPGDAGYGRVMSDAAVSGRAAW